MSKEPKVQVFERREFRGLYTLRKASELPLNFAAHVLNIDLGSSSQISPLPMYTLFGNQDNATHKTRNLFKYRRGSGFETLLHIRDDGTNTFLEYLNPGDNRTSANGEWTQLVSGLTTAKIMSFAPFNDTTVDNLVMSNGIDSVMRWSGAQCVLNGAHLSGAATLTVKKITGDPKTNATDGFPSTGNLTIKADNDTILTVAYTGKTATTFTGVTGFTADCAANAGVAHQVDTSTYSGMKKFAWLLTAQGRMWGGGVPGEETVLYASTVSDFTDLDDSAGVTPNAPIVEDFPELGATIGAVAIDNWIVLFSEDQVIGIQFEYPTSTTRVARRKHISDIGLGSKKAIDRVGNDYIYASPSGQLRRLSRVMAEDSFFTEDLTDLIRPSIESFVWDDCSLRYWPKKRILVASAKSSSDVSDNDKLVYIQFSKDSQNNPIMNHGISDIFWGDGAVYDDNFYFGGSVESRIFKAFDGYSKNGAAYSAEYTTRLEHFGEEFSEKEILYLGVKGRIGAGSTINFDVLFDENGRTAEYPFDLDDSDDDYITQGVSNPLGTNALGSEPLGGTIEDVDELDPYEVYFEIPIKANPKMVQLNIHGDSAGQRWTVDSLAWFVSIPENQSPNPKLLKGSS